jgi:DNA adenine methylase
MNKTESPMKVTAIAPWFGAKRQLAPAIIAEIGPHSAWWEIFCGSLAVTLAKPPSAIETVNDLHSD